MAISTILRGIQGNPSVHTPADYPELARTEDDSTWNDNELLCLRAEHPCADLMVLWAVRDAVAAKLAEGERPYAAVLALAARTELATEEVQRLGTLCGASARLRTRLDRRLALRA